MADVTDLHGLAVAFLDEVALALDTIPDYAPLLEGAPERQFVSPGEPVVDFVSRDCCSQIAVWVTPIVEMDTTPGGNQAGRRSQRGAWMNNVFLNAQVNRCIPVGESSSMNIYTPPSADELTEAAAQINADGWALWNYLHSTVQAGSLSTLCGNVLFVGINALIPSGGCAGWLVTLRVELGGYTESISS